MKNVKTTFNGANQSNVHNPVAKESSPVALVSAAADQLDQKVRSMMKRTEHEIIKGTKKEKAFACTECAYLIFVIFFTRAKFLEKKYTPKNANFSRQICKKRYFFA